jgi:hypothetical protein
MALPVLSPAGSGAAPQQATISGHGIRVKIMSIHGCQLTPSSLCSHLAVMPARSALIVSVDRTAPRPWRRRRRAGPPGRRRRHR